MGTPDFAVYSLRALQESTEHEVVSVITQPDQPKGRGYQLLPPPVKVYALRENLPVFQPKTVKDEAFMEQLKAWDPDVIVVAAFGKILPKSVLDFPKHGCLCVHSSILPKYRGAAPIQRAMMNGEAEMGVTIMQMDPGIDTGDMLTVKRTPFAAEDDFETMHDRLADLGAKALLETLEAMQKGTLQAEKQDDSQMTYAAKIEKSDCLLHFEQDATTLWNQIRALSPVPLAFTYLNGSVLKVVRAQVEKKEGQYGAAGTVLSLDKGVIEVACGNGTLALQCVVPQGKGKMSGADFIRGRKITCGDQLKETV